MPHSFRTFRDGASDRRADGFNAKEDDINLQGTAVEAPYVEEGRSALGEVRNEHNRSEFFPHHPFMRRGERRNAVVPCQLFVPKHPVRALRTESRVFQKRHLGIQEVMNVRSARKLKFSHSEGFVMPPGFRVRLLPAAVGLADESGTLRSEARQEF